MCERENEKGVTIKGSFIVTLFESKLVFMTVLKNVGIINLCFHE